MKPAHLTSETPNAVLFELAREGSAEAYDLWVDRHWLRLYCVAMSSTRDFNIARNVTRESVKLGWRRVKSAEDSSRLLSWLKQIVAGLSLGACRQRDCARQNVRELLAQGESSLQDAQYHEMNLQSYSEQLVWKQEATVQLLRAAHHLPEPLAEAAFLRFFEGYTIEQIATCLEIPLSEARLRVGQAALKLAPKLRPVYEELLPSVSEKS